MGISIAGNNDGKGFIKSLSNEYKGSLLEIGDVIESVNGIVDRLKNSIYIKKTFSLFLMQLALWIC